MLTGLLRKISLVLALAWFIGVVSLIPVTTVSAHAVAQQTATLTVHAPEQVQSGELIHIELTLKDTPNFGGYEAALLYDPGAVEFAGIVQPQNGGRGTVPLVVVHTEAGSA